MRTIYISQPPRKKRSFLPKLVTFGLVSVLIGGAIWFAAEIQGKTVKQRIETIPIPVQLHDQ